MTKLTTPAIIGIIFGIIIVVIIIAALIFNKYKSYKFRMTPPKIIDRIIDRKKIDTIITHGKYKIEFKYWDTGNRTCSIYENNILIRRININKTKYKTPIYFHEKKDNSIIIYDTRNNISIVEAYIVYMDHIIDIYGYKDRIDTNLDNSAPV